MLLDRIDHVGHAVADLDEAIAHHERLYAATVAHREVVDSDGVAEALIAVGGSYIQLLAPTRDDSPIARWMERNGGPGIHHVGYGVRDVAAALDAMAAQGARLIDTVPRPGSRGTRIAFVHPKGALGALVELVEDPARA